MGRVLGKLAMGAIALALLVLVSRRSRRQDGSQHPYLVGAATHSINPDPDGTFAGKPVYLGGYGIGGGSPVLAGRPATGVLGDGLERARVRRRPTATTPSRSPTSRRRAGSPRSRTGPTGWSTCARRSSGAPPACCAPRTSSSRATTATAGRTRSACGAECRTSTCSYVADQTVDDDRRGVLGDAPGQALLRHRAGPRPALEPVRLRRGEQGRRLGRARAAGARRRRRPLVTLLNFSAHTTVLGSGNTKVVGRLGAGAPTRCWSSASAARR